MKQDISSPNTFSRDQLEKFTVNIFLKMGVPERDAKRAAEVIIAADLRGIDSHGVARLSGYVRLWEQKRINANPSVKVVHETPSTATVDGDEGLGLVVAQEAMNIAIKKAKECGSGWVSVMNSNHFGIAAFHAMLALEHDMIGIAMTNASPLVAPAQSVERMLGTNPMCYAIPAGKYEPVIVDMATSAAANGKLEIAQRSGKKIPSGWVQDAVGNQSTDPDELKKGGSLLPLGSDSERGFHKGFGLSAVVDIFSGVLSGANYGPWVPPFVSFLAPDANPVGKGIGHFLGAMRIDGFRPGEEFKTQMDNWISRFKNAKPAKGFSKVIIPGEPEMVSYRERTEGGIPLNENVISDLRKLGQLMNIGFPEPSV